FTYTPTTGFAGTDQFTYTISDGNGGTDTATVTLTVAPNTAPDAANDSFTGDFNQPIEGDVLANDSDPDGDDLTVIGNTDPLNGTVTVNQDGTFTYTPETGFAGTDQFTYTISDGNGGTDTATVTLTVGERPNEAPIAVADTINGQEGEPIEGSVLDNDSDPDGDPLKVIDNTAPSNGKLVIGTDGKFIYIPDDGFAGEDSFTYTVSDGNGGTDTATVTLNVNARPEANDDIVNGQEGAPIEGAVLDNDTDVDGDPLTIIGNTEPENGTLLLNDDGTFTYVPDDGFFGQDSFTYTVSDGNGGTDTATVTLNVNAGPDANDDIVNGQEGAPIEGSVLDNDTDADGDPLTIIGNTEPENGTLVLNEDGTFTYVPDDGFSGQDSFTYTVSDGNGGTDTATVTLNVNGAPVAEDDVADGAFNSTIEGSVLDNDSDPDGDDLTVIGNTAPANGSVVINANGQFVYVPNEGFSGEDSFTYTVSDGKGGTDTATVTVNVGEQPNTAPEANDDIVNGQEGAPIEGSVLDNDTDADGDPLTIIGNTEPENGTLVLNEDGTFTYVPDDGFSGQDSFTYTVSDGNGGTDTATVTLNVNGAPVAEDDVADGAFNSAIEGSVLDNDSDPDGDDLTVIGNTAPANGSVVINANGQFVYVPNEGFSGEDSFTYTVSDGNGGTDTATVTVNVAERPNTEPDAENDFFSGAFNQAIEGSVLDNDTDADGDPLTVIGNTDPANGTVTMNPDGTFTYTPNDGFAGEDSFTYTISDGNGGQDTATVNLFTEKECAPANRPPVAVDDKFETMGIDKAFEGNVLDNDSDPDGDPLTVKLNTQPANGTVTMQPDGSFTYKPNAGFFGKDTFEYVVSDGNGGADHATVHITVPCFAAGTLIVTAEGPKLVEDIKIGDKVLTRDDGFQQVRWAGQRTLDTAYLTRNPDFVSVLIRAGALGNQMPRRDLRVSPGHRMLISGYQAELLFGEREVLVAACDLVGQPGIEHDPRPVTYVHIMFDSHQIIDSEGAWSESFQPADVTLNGLDTQQRDELLALFPELATRKGQGEYAAARRVLARHESSALLSM
ncbi:Ig-like domain-containing protein, partial [Roseinatronobacter bogoriensis]